MPFLERFRSQPKWKHRDPAVRLAAVEELPLGEQAVLAALAREDQDAGVRRAAVAKLTDLAVVAEIRDGDSDGGVREAAGQLIVDTALGAFEGTTEDEGLSALASIDEVRDLVSIAKEAGSARVARSALDRVRDEKLVGSIARRSLHADVRLAALGRVEDPAEIAAIALRTDFKDVAAAAVERLADAAALENVASRAKSKAAARAARAALRVQAARVASAAAPVPAEAPAAAQPGLGVRAIALCEAVEALASARDHRDLQIRLANAEAAWAVISPPDEAVRTRFEMAVSQARARLEILEAQEAEQARKEEAVRAELAERAALVARAEALTGEIRAVLASEGAGDDPDQAAARVAGALERLQAVTADWQAQPALPGDVREGVALAGRFRAASIECQRLNEQWAALRARRLRLGQLAEEAETIAGETDLAAARARWTTFRQQWTAAAGSGPVDTDLTSRVSTAEAALRSREEEAREARSRRERENAERLVRLAEQAEALAARESLALKEGDRVARELKVALERPGPLPSRREREALSERLRHAQTLLAPRLQELREADEWQRWANATIQEELCGKAEALADQPDPAEAARSLRELQAQWKKVALVPHDRAQALWLRFKAAQDAVRGRTEAYFSAQAEERAANLVRKEALCQRAEALATSTDWIRTAEAIKTLQAEWKTVGPVPRGQEKAIWDRFHAACDAFFTKRREDLTRRKEAWAANLGRKQALISQVDALGAGGDWDRAPQELRRVQAEWRAVGPVRKKHADELWQRFQDACAGFQERFVQRDELQMAANVSAREAACRILEDLLPASEGTAPAPLAADEVVRRLRDGWARWEQGGPVPSETLAALTERFRGAFAGAVKHHVDEVKGTEFDAEMNLQKMDELCRRVEELGPAEAAMRLDESPAAILAARWREALAANTIAGTASSAATDEARRRAIADAVRAAQSEWKLIGHVPDDLARPLAVRFQKACNRALEQQRRRS